MTVTSHERSPATVLLVEDHVDSRQMYAEFLRSQGYEPVCNDWDSTYVGCEIRTPARAPLLGQRRGPAATETTLAST